ncbi:hypothetical protein INT45_011129 [Circinella minor]|uniref:Uncharacterized protein n=1 Tax=Circinella minor TaxID=1195481 RepID=A0A8H7VR62_9FUNG|nr:hypothetical protein INT45_011129 [Circinella minor]
MAKYARAAIIKEEASKKLEHYSMDRLGELWKKFKEEKRSQPKFLNSDWTLEILHVQKIGLQRAEQYNKQSKAARARVERELKLYNDIRGEATEHLKVRDILMENSTFRRECNVFHHEIYPFDQYHNYQRADEEFRILKVNEAKSVLDFGARAVHLLKSALNLKLDDTEEWWYTQFQMLSNFLTDSELQNSTEEDNDNIEDGIARHDDDFTDLTTTQTE